jgi:energy-coupling factor transporter ATP-binding protein EcfA2
MFERVGVRYEPGARCAVEDVSFSVVPGERVGLVGLNGSGKTTLLMATVGLVPHQGTIRVCGATLSPKTLTDVRDRVGFLFNVPEDQLLFPKVIDDVAFGLVRRGTPAREAYGRAAQVLDALGVAGLAEAPLHHLSHGQKQRVALAGALVTDPPVLLLDEPSAGLDPPARRGLVRVLAAESAAMLVATHDFDFAARLCTRFVMLDEGRVAFDGANLAEVVRHWESHEGA